MTDLTQFTLVTFTSVLFIVDPIAAVPTYLVITQLESPLERRRTARRLGEPLLGRLGRPEFEWSPGSWA